MPAAGWCIHSSSTDYDIRVMIGVMMLVCTQQLISALHATWPNHTVDCVLCFWVPQFHVSPSRMHGLLWCRTCRPTGAWWCSALVLWSSLPPRNKVRPIEFQLRDVSTHLACRLYSAPVKHACVVVCSLVLYPYMYPAFGNCHSNRHGPHSLIIANLETATSVQVQQVFIRRAKLQRPMHLFCRAQGESRD